jgi:hypothetical protein
MSVSHPSSPAGTFPCLFQRGVPRSVKASFSEVREIAQSVFYPVSKYQFLLILAFIGVSCCCSWIQFSFILFLYATFRSYKVLSVSVSVLKREEKSFKWRNR